MSGGNAAVLVCMVFLVIIGAVQAFRGFSRGDQTAGLLGLSGVGIAVLWALLILWNNWATQRGKRPW